MSERDGTTASPSQNGTPEIDDREPELSEDPPTELDDDFLAGLTSEGGHE